MSSKIAYLIPGLGLNGALFQKLTIDGYNLQIINWLEPNEKERFNEYIQRIIKKYDIHSSPNNIIVGHSFGGIVAQEIALSIDLKHIFLLNSIQSHTSLPSKLSILKTLPFHHLLKTWHLKYSFPLWKHFHDYNSLEKETLFHNCVNLYSDYYFKWAINHLIHWKGDYNIPHLTQIHGTRDNTFPAKLIDNAILIDKGSHLMVLSEFEVINQIIKLKLDIAD